MQSCNLQIPPVVASWIKSLQLNVPLHYLKHDFASGYAVGLLLNKVYGDVYETRTLENNTSTSCAWHNWGRILELERINSSSFALGKDIVERIIAKDEKAVLDLLISIYQDSTGNTVPKIVYPTIPREKKQLKSPPTTLKAAPNVSILSKSPERVAAQPEERNYPPGIPMFARGGYDNSRQLIDHLNAACKESVEEFEALHEFIEMLDPRADFCYPYAQLLLRLPKQYAFRVCQSLSEKIDVQLISSCISTDYMLFYDFAVILLESGVALNEVCADASTLFTTITDILCRVIEEVKRESEDAVYIIYENIIMSRLIKEIPLINYSLTHFFRLCLVCLPAFTSAAFNKIMAAFILNIRNTCPLYSENRLRLEVLLSFAMYSLEFGAHKDEIARACIKYTLHSILLPNQEKFLAIDLFVRCIYLSPSLFKDCEFAFLRLIGFLVNRNKKCDQDDLISEANQEKPLVIECHQYEFEFWFNDIHELNYEQVLFLVLAMQKLIKVKELESSISNIEKVHKHFLNVLVMRKNTIPPCFYYIGTIGIASMNHQRIATARIRLEEILSENGDIGTKITEANTFLDSTGLYEFVSSITEFLQTNFQQINAVFSIIDGAIRETDMLHSLAEANNFNPDLYIQSDILDDVQTQLADFFFQKVVKTLYAGTHAQDMVVLVTYIFIQRFEISEQSLRMLICLLAMDGSLATYAFETLHDELFTSILSEDEQISIGASDCLLLILIQSKFEECHDETRNSLHALVDFCFNYNGRDLTDTVPRKNVQKKCLRFLEEMEPVPEFGEVLLELVEKLDFDDFGNDELAQFISVVRGEI